MNHIVVVGSGASGVHFARAALQKGYRVTMLDVGHQGHWAAEPDQPFDELRTGLDDPVGYFLGKNYEAIRFPGARGEYYAFPPNKRYIFEWPESVRVDSRGFHPLLSFAQGGLAETWTGGAYPLNDAELEDFPFDYAELAPHYAEVAAEIGISGEEDDLARFFPSHAHLMPPTPLDAQSELLLARYGRCKRLLNERWNVFLGRSRSATITRPLDGRRPCDLKGRCLWGCPSHSLYTPAVTLQKCLQHENFTYVPGMDVRYFTYDRHRRVTSLLAESLADAAMHSFAGEAFVLAAGTLSSSRIFLESLYRGSGQIVRLTGLMDNRQVLVPYLHWSMVGRRYDPRTFQYHQLALGIADEQPKHYVHCQITTLKAALAHPILHSVPLDLRSALALFRNLRAGLGMVNINCHDVRRSSSYVTLDPAADPAHPALRIVYREPEREARRLKRVITLVKKCLRQLGCVVPPPMTHIRPMGASVHYAGTLPMSVSPRPLTTSPSCRSHDFENLYFVDGTTFPFLPAKNLTFTLMANATRVAKQAL